MTAEINRLMDSARVRLPGTLDGTLQLELFSVFDEFLRETNAWTQDVSFNVEPVTQSFQENPSSYTYQITAAGEIIRLLDVRNAHGIKQHATMPVPGSVIISTPPAQTETFTARVSLTVSDPVGTDGFPALPVWILRKYGTDLLDGLLGKMMSQPAKPYTSLSLAVAHMRKFRSSISKAKVETIRQNVYGAQNWRFPQTFARRR
jgi:hypothetical protein